MSVHAVVLGQSATFFRCSCCSRFVALPASGETTGRYSRWYATAHSAIPAPATSIEALLRSGNNEPRTGGLVTLVVRHHYVGYLRSSLAGIVACTDDYRVKTPV